MTRRSLLTALPLAFLDSVCIGAQRGATERTITVYKDPSCGCCTNWSELLRKGGFAVTIRSITELDTAKYAVPTALHSCHTAIVDGHIVEGHVPVADVQRMLRQGDAVYGLSVALSAQDSRVKSRTNIKADDATVTSMTGCLGQQGSGVYTLNGTVATSGKEIETNSKVKTDVDKDKTTVRGKTETKANDGAVATAGSASTFLLVPGNNVDLASHVGERVRISAIMVKPGRGDADVKIKDKTKVDSEGAPDAKSQSRTKLELPRSSAGRYTVMSITPTGTRCAY